MCGLLGPAGGGARFALTVVIQMLAHLRIAVAAGGYVEITLYFVPLDRPEDTTGIRHDATADLRRHGEPLLPPRGRQIVVDVLLAGILRRLLGRPAPVAVLAIAVRGSDDTPVAIDGPTAGFRRPCFPRRHVLVQCITREDSIARGVLHVDVEVIAFHLRCLSVTPSMLVNEAETHGNHDIQIHLQRMTHSPFYTERMSRLAAEPSRHFGASEPGAQ